MLLDLLGGEKELLVELIDSFLEEAPSLLSRLRQAAQQNDASGLRMAAHTLKSSSNDFGAKTLAELCQAMENRGKSGVLTPDTQDKVAQIETEYQHVKAALEKLRDD